VQCNLSCPSQITKLKIDSNPFAKGFRDSSRLTDFERETMESMLESQFLRSQQSNPGQGRSPACSPVVRPAALPCHPLSLEERALILARSHLLRNTFPAPPLARPALPLPGLWGQWVQLQQLNSQLLARQQQAAALQARPALPGPRPASPSPSRSPSPLQVDS
jgi:T-box protein 20